MVPNLILKSLFRSKGNFERGARTAIRRFENVEITPFFGAALASATISADFELSWAFRWYTEERRRALASNCRKNVPLIIGLLEKHQAPITWATVGHLFLEHCERDPAGHAHPDMPRPPHAHPWHNDWYWHDPCTNWKQDPLWYCPDLIQLLLKSATPQEIGSHSFSHIDFSEAASTPELVRAELEACRKVMAPLGLELRSLVYPFNRMGHHHLDLIGGLGLTAVRHRDPKIKLTYPERTPSGMYKLYESMNFRRARFYDYVDKAQMVLEEAEKQQAAFHIWFHPSDPTATFEREFDGIIGLMAKERDAGRIWIATMGQLAAYCEARHQTSIQARRAEGKLNLILTSAYDAKRYGPTDLTLEITDAPAPIECQMVKGDKVQSIPWKTREGKPGGKNSTLVNVPAVSGELRLVFTP